MCEAEYWLNSYFFKLDVIVVESEDHRLGKHQETPVKAGTAQESYPELINFHWRTAMGTGIAARQCHSTCRHTTTQCRSSTRMTTLHV